MLQENFRNKNCASKETSKFSRLTLFATRMTIKKFEYSKAIETWWMRSYLLSPEFNSERTPSDNQFILFVMVIAKILSNVKMVDAPGNWLKLNSC